MTGSRVTSSLVVAAPPEAVFDYLVDPHHRAEWQSSLARVEDVVGEVGVGQRWVDVTSPGLRPLMETTAYDRPHRWTERGTWRGFAAELTLTFEPVGPEGRDCRVGWTMRLQGRGPARPLAAVLNRLAPLAVRSDLARAGAIVSRSHRP